MQINDGSGWLPLLALSEPDELDGGTYGFAVPYDPVLRGFAAAMRLSEARGHAMFRGKRQEGDGYPYWVSMSTTPEMPPEKPMIVWLSISPADQSENAT
jgi:hypothetical protein